MKLFKAIAGISAIFLLGALTGVLGTGLVVQHRIATFHEKGPPPFKPIFMKRLTHHLELNPEQKIAVAKILEDTQKRLGQLRKAYKPQAKKIFSECFTRIERHLTPIQQKRLMAIQERLPRMMRPHVFKKGPYHRPEARHPRPEAKTWEDAAQK